MCCLGGCSLLDGLTLAWCKCLSFRLAGNTRAAPRGMARRGICRRTSGGDAGVTESRESEDEHVEALTCASCGPMFQPTQGTDRECVLDTALLLGPSRHRVAGQRSGSRDGNCVHQYRVGTRCRGHGVEEAGVRVMSGACRGGRLVCGSHLMCFAASPYVWGRPRLVTNFDVCMVSDARRLQ